VLYLLICLSCVKYTHLFVYPTDSFSDAACRCHSQWEGPHCEYAKNATSSSGPGSTAAGTGLEVTTMSDQSSAANSDSGMSGPAKFGITLIILVCGAVMAFGAVVYRRQRIITELNVAPVYPDLDHNLALDDESFRAAPVVDVGPEKDFDGNELKDVEFT